MAQTLLPDPAALHLESILENDGKITFHVTARQKRPPCPLCGDIASRIHSRYSRTVMDLPWQGIAVGFRLTCRKFFCDNVQCARRIFTEPLPLVVQRYARKTVRLSDALRELAFLTGGEVAARIARTFGLLVSPDALLDTLKAAQSNGFASPRVLGVDDFAFKKGRRYGTILVDLERRVPLDLLPNREPQTLALWLRNHPDIEIISRDRAAAYSEGARCGAPQALQVADRWHLLKNLGDALERFLIRHYATLRTQATEIAADAIAVAETTGVFPPLIAPPPAPLTQGQEAEKHMRRARRFLRFEEVKRLHEQGLSQREIARRTGFSRNSIRRFLRGEHFPEIAARPPRQSKLTPFAGHLRNRWKDGCYNATELHQEIITHGFTGSLDLVQRFVAGWRETPRSRTSGRHPPPLVPTTGHLAFVLMNPEHQKVTNQIRAFVVGLTKAHPVFGQAQALAREFCRLIRERDASGFSSWLEAVSVSDIRELKGFARGLVQDRAAVENALRSEWSNTVTLA